MPQSSPPSLAVSTEMPTKFRWVICGLLFYATTVNYIDRSTLNTLEPTLRDIIHWRFYQYGLINAVFSLAYGLGFLIMGGIIDKVGTRMGYAISIVGWSLAGIGTAFTNTAVQFGLARFCLGLCEAGNFPAAIKTVAEWFPQKQRATATGIFNAGSNIGAVIAPLLVLFVLPVFGWRAVFLVTPLLAIIWLVLWLRYYRSPAEQPRANDAERRLIEADPIVAPRSVKWRYLLPHRQAWAFMMGKFMTDPIWWFYLFWSGAFFSDKFGVKLAGVALPLIYVYALADVGSVGGGWISSWFIKHGWTPNRARKTSMVICAAFVVPVVFAPLVPNNWTVGYSASGAPIAAASATTTAVPRATIKILPDPLAKRAVTPAATSSAASAPSVAAAAPGGGLFGGFNYGLWIAATLIGLAAAAHQGFSANLFTTTSDMFPKRAVSSITGLGGFTGSMGSMILQSVAGVTLELTSGSYFILFVAAACAYPIGTLLIHLFSPRLEPVPEQRLESTPMPRGVTALIFAVFCFVLAVPASYFFQNKTDYRLLDRKTLVTVTFSDHVDLIPKDLLDSAALKNPDKDAPAVVLTLKHAPTPTEAASLAFLESFPVHAYDKSLQYIPQGFTFSEYMAAVLPPGNIYKSMDRGALLPALVATPLVGAAIGALLGALLHGVLFSNRRRK